MNETPFSAAATFESYTKVKISIITVVYNGEKTIQECIASVLGQDYFNIEYIIVDGASTDDTLSVVQRYADRITRVVSEPDQGIYDAMNKGIGYATGEVVGVLNADDVYASPTVLSQVAAAFQTQQCEACYGDLWYVSNDSSGHVTRKWVSGKYREGAFLWGWMPPHPTFFVKRESYQRYGLFRLDMGSAADYELMLRLIHRYKIRLSYLPRVLVKMRVGGVSNTSWRNRWKANRKDREAWKVNGLEANFWTHWLKPLRKIGQFLR